MSLSGEREEGTTASKMSLSGEREEGTTASKMSLSGEREEGTTASKKTQDTSSKSVQKPRAESPAPSLLSMKSDQPPAFSQEPLPDDNKEVESLDSEDALKITHNLLDRRSQTLLTVQQDIKAKLKHKYQHISEGIGHHGNQSLLKDIYTELYITEGGSGGVNNEHEVRQIEMTSKKQTTQETPIKCNDIFKPLAGQDKPIRTVLTKGIAGIGKTVSVQKVILDWAEGKANQDVHFMFPLPFRDLNLKKDQYSLMQLLSHYFSELKEIDSIEDGETKTVFIFDGLDECRLPLDFKNNERCCDVTKPTSVDVLLTNLIKGNLLPSALLWITSRPAAANQIPPECVDQVTEVRGFNDPQKEEYFRKKITDQNLANEIIKHMKTSRSLHIMCHMPVFCWISATVLEMMLKEAEKDEVPKTLTQMFTHFTLIQIIVKNKKYNKATETNPKELSQSDKEMILKLAKLAFQQLQKGNLIFYEEDLRECGLDVTEASEYSALCTEIFKEESGLYQEKVYSFVHLSIQEFLAAVHALESCLDKKENVFPHKASDPLYDLHRRAVDQALKSENGHLDLFLRFLLGLSLESNQNLLRGLLTQTGSTTQSNEETVERTVRYLSDKIEWESSPERIINLFHCLNELGANSLVEEMQTSLRSGTLSETDLKPDQCSALAYLLLMSEEVLEEFDLKTYTTSEEGYQRLMPVVNTCRRALLSGCKLTYESCETLASALQTPNSPLRELDLSYNDLGDRGVELLCVGLTSPLCNIQTLVLSGCLVTEEGCAALSSALRSNPSHLKELDLSYNHPGDSAGGLLSAALVDPTDKLMKLKVDHGGEFRLKPGLRKYACHLTLDPNTANPYLILSEGNRKVTRVEEKQHYEDHPDRFDHDSQVLCREGLSGSRYYWEVERDGGISHIGVVYKGMQRKGVMDSWIGGNRKSWSLVCSDSGYDFYHAGVGRSIPGPVSNRVGVYLDWPAGTLSFYSVSSSGTLTHLYTEHTTFTEPLYPGFGFEDYSSSSVTLCQIDDQHIQSRDHGGECCIKPGPENTRDQIWIPQSCKTCDHVEDSTHWLQIEPLTSTVQGVTMFRHRTPKGRYECTVSGLRWVCDRDVILKYHFRNWEPYSHLLKDMQYGQGGPLLDITMELGELEEVHLPHFVCLGTNPSLRNEMKILHVEEHGVSVEEVHEVTRFHAKILHPKFSAIAVILSYIFFWNVDVHCDVVLYMAVKKATVISRLYMLLRNSSQKEAVRDREKNQVSQGYSEFLLSSPNGSLKLNSWFAVKNPHSSSIYPEKIQLLPADTTPSCCKMVMRNTGVDIEMELIGDDERTVWKSVVSKDEYSKDSHPIALTVPDIPAEEFLKKHWAKLIQRTKNSMPIADDLWSKNMIGEEEHSRITAETTEQDRMRKLLKAVIPKGPEVTGACLKALVEHENHLVKDLSESGT
ncbi:NACHT, LRR and PYD domains-containing protein 5-like [Coregonus clupeaformis]|uniref:NACHT, LRR and PYD domains-containing protein 5-like n=1 Tax=Coregonus clupeaformis TaxID=59861 RepID=UPI001E1C4297|nr:NACHT, LRR and PYD domains-containing protein 5-like [Coregonus clupeaformis]